MRSVFVVFGLLLFACTPKEPVEIGASCSAAEKIEACAVGKVALCVGGKWQETVSCPQGCTRKTIGHGSTAAVCGETFARVGNVCSTWKSRICSEDRNSQLVCEGGRWKMEKACSTSCTYSNSGIACQ